MYSIKFSLLVGLLLIVESCNTTKPMVNKDSEDTTTASKQMDEKFVNQGYSIGVVKSVSNSKCPYIIVDKMTGATFDPINIQEKKFISFQKDLEQIYFKYRSLRMMNRCNDARPIELEDIKKRED